MPISQKSIKILWAASAGRCSFPECQEQLACSKAGEFAPFTIGEMAHVCGEKPGSNRHDETQTPLERDDYQNLILLCPTHHTLIDRKENEGRFSRNILLKMKGDHEAFILTRLHPEPPLNSCVVAKQIVPLLAANHLVWRTYGPFSDVARENPHSEGAHSMWVSERLSTIVPNNRLITQILNAGRVTFAPEQQAAIEIFLLHSRSYERWVEDEISYEGVVRFPQEFDSLMKGQSDASS